MVKATQKLLAFGACIAFTLSLQGCGGNTPSPSPAPPTPTPPPTPSPTPSPPSSWKLEPIEVRGSHLYGSRTGKQFFAKGFAFPNVNVPTIKTWIKMLEKINELAPHVNTVRIYELPACAVKAADDHDFCSFKEFMLKADELGIYVIIPASGTIWGWFPGHPDACHPRLTNSTSDDLNGCYNGSAGGILGFGLNMINNFNFPNTLALVLANEVEQNYQAFPVLKAYARDMKNHMSLCDSNGESPTKGKMRQIPITYAATDTGNDALLQLADYLLCDSRDVSLDIVGVNIERWTNDKGGRDEYRALSVAVGQKKYPAAWIHTEEGGPDHDHKSRTWHQVEGFFANYPHFDGYCAYAWYSANHDFDMFDALDVNATMYPDGKAFFDSMSKCGPDPATTQSGDTVTPTCLSTLSRSGKTYPMADFNKIKVYDTGANAYAKNCPAPWQDMQFDAIQV